MAQARAQAKCQGPGGQAGSRTAAEWVARAALALVAVALGCIGVSETLANVIAVDDPAAARALAYGNGPILAADVDQGFAVAPNSSSSSRQAQLSRKALQLDPTAVEAVDVLALQAELRSERASADRLFEYSFALSRRELQPQLWAIEQAVARGDIGQALRYYDIALRTSDDARDMLYPVLASALAEPLVRRPLIAMLGSKPVWGESFIRYAAEKGSVPSAVAQLFQEGAGKGLPIDDSEKAQVVANLIGTNMVDEAWSFYRTFRPGAGPTRSRDPDFMLGVDAASPFDWKLADEPGVSAAILRKGRGGLLDFAAPPSNSATVASQVEILPPGQYRLQGRSRGVSQAKGSLPYWLLACRGGVELGRIDVPSSGDAEAAFSGYFSVPAGCPVQTLSLVVRASDNVAGVSGQIEHVQLTPAGS